MCAAAPPVRVDSHGKQWLLGAPSRRRGAAPALLCFRSGFPAPRACSRGEPLLRAPPPPRFFRALRGGACARTFVRAWGGPLSFPPWLSSHAAGRPMPRQPVFAPAAGRRWSAAHTHAQPSAAPRRPRLSGGMQRAPAPRPGPATCVRPPAPAATDPEQQNGCGAASFSNTGRTRWAGRVDARGAACLPRRRSHSAHLPPAGPAPHRPPLRTGPKACTAVFLAPARLSRKRLASGSQRRSFPSPGCARATRPCRPPPQAALGGLCLDPTWHGGSCEPRASEFLLFSARSPRRVLPLERARGVQGRLKPHTAACVPDSTFRTALHRTTQ